MTLEFPAITVEICLDNVAWHTAVTWTDVSSRFLRATFSRGRQRQLNQPRTGELRVVLDNADGHLTPTNAASPYAGTMRPGRIVRVRATYDGITYGQFVGAIMNWPVTPMRAGQPPTVELLAVDQLGLMTTAITHQSGLNNAGTVISEWLTAPGGAVGAIDIDAGRTLIWDIDSVPGDSTYFGSPGTGDPVDYTPRQLLDLVSGSEAESTYFVAGDGTLCWHDGARRHGVALVVRAVFDNDYEAQALGALPYSDARHINDDAQIYNVATLNPPAASIGRPGGSVVGTIVDTTSRTRYGQRTWPSSSTYNVAPDLQVEQIITRHAAPVAQIESVTVDGVGASGALWRAALALDISDPIRVVDRQWPNAATPIIYDSWIEGVDVTIDNNPPTWRVVYALSPWVEGFHPPLIGGSGVAFPLYPSPGDRFWRTDLKQDFYYSGSQWLSAQQFVAPLQLITTLPVTATGSVAMAATRSDYNILVESVQYTSLVVAPNDASNYWTLVVYDGTSSYGTRTTAADTASAWTRSSLVGIGAGITTASRLFLYLYATKFGSPGGLRATAQIFYRLTAT